MQKFGFVFPGQGSQRAGMLADLASRHSLITETFSEASEALDLDLWKICQNDPDGTLDRTDITQPALLTASVAIWRLWKASGGADPAMVAGHSLGEYSALVCADVLEFEAAVRLVRKRGEYMMAAVPPGKGAMAAILGLDEERIISLCAEVAGSGVVAAANFNSPGQTVIAGDADAVERAMAACKEAGAKRALPIKVSVPSHCALMQPAATALARDLEALTFRGAQFPVVQNVNAEVATSPESIKQNLIDQLHQPVRWVDCVRLIHQSGIGQLVECGPGKVLSGLITRIESTLLCHSSEDPANFQQALEAVTG